MELIFRQRLDRPDKLGRAVVFGDLHWAGGHRWKMPTGVKVLPAHWQPTKAKRIHTGADNANALNLRLGRLLTAVQGVFTAAEGAGKPEADVTQADLEAAVLAVGAGTQRRAQPTPAAVAQAAADAPIEATATWTEFEARWRAENEHLLSDSYLRMYKQVATSLTEFDAHLRLATLTRERLAQYVAWLFGQGKRDSTVQRHYVFLRECQRLAGRPVPKWLAKFTVRAGRSPALRRAEVQALATAELPADLAEERDMFLLQLHLLLRDVDLRALRPHHVSLHELPGHGPTLCVELYQQKTSEPVVIPLPPAAVAIWQRCGGQLNMPSQQERNRRLKHLGLAAGLTREFVQVAFSGKTRAETVVPIWQVLTTHTARHTGAALLVLGSEGDQTLKEIALGHVSASVYGYDTLERYGPRLLEAWQVALGQ